jgi:UDP-glucose 4-epimerase
MDCLVTGGAGFIGSTLVDRLLDEGHNVDVIDNLSSGRLSNLEDAQASGRLRLHQLDIRDADTLGTIEGIKPEVIFHLAAQADVRVSVADPVLDASINIVGTLNVLEGARRAGTRRVVAAASGGTLYGEPPASAIPTKETFAQQPLSPYGVSKKSMIDYLVAYRALHGLEYLALALANVYGPRQDPHGEAGVVAIFAEKLLEGDPVTIFGDGEQTRDFVFVDDVVDAFARSAIRSGNQVINIGTGRELSVNDLYRTMASVTGERAPASYAPPRAGELQRSCLDVSRAASELDWSSWTTFEDGAAATIESVRRQLASS